jgi:4-hydroxy-tetrahydrodipicolinate reductase
MKIALVGYGKMGKVIEKIALERGHEITARINSKNLDEMLSLKGKCDVAIEFSRPESAMQNFRSLIDQKIPVVTGTTGWYENFDDLKREVESRNAAFFYATNFSVGVNLFFELNKRLASMMRQHPEYKVSIDETHHTQKLDAPSGTAITLAEAILDSYDNLDGWKLDGDSEEQLNIRAQRAEGVPGTHEIHYRSEIDDIEIKHTAHSRKGFALGSVLAAEFLKDKTGMHTMKDLLKN